MAKRKPNILFIQADQQRMDALGCYGNPIVRTPNLDRLAAGGVRFENAFTCTGVCTPARGALLSGQYPHRSGMVHNPELPGNRYGRRLCEFDSPVEPFSGILSAAGYDLHHVGKWHIGSWFGTKPAHFGFTGQFYPGYGYPREHPHYDRFLRRRGADGFGLHKARGGGQTKRYFNEHRVAPEASIPGYLCGQAVDRLRRCAKSARPFFLGLNFWGPHIPVNIPPEYLYMYHPADMPLPPSFANVTDHRPAIVDKAHRMWGGAILDEAMARRIIAAYYGYVTLIDHQVGRVLDALEATGQADDTVVIFTSDHGSTLGSHGLQDKGLNMYDDVYRIPLIISGPRVAKPGTSTDRFAITMDLSATFVDLAARRVPKSYDGAPLTPFMRGELRHTIRKEIVMEGFGHQVPFLQRAIRDRRYKYIFSATAIDEFYDIQADPHERRNLIDSADAKLIARCRRKLIAWGAANADHVTATFARLVDRPAHVPGPTA